MVYTTDGIKLSGIASDFCLPRTENQELGTGNDHNGR